MTTRRRRTGANGSRPITASHIEQQRQHYEALHLLRTIRHAVEVVLLIVFIVGLVLGFMIGRAVGHRRSSGSSPMRQARDCVS